MKHISLRAATFLLTAAIAGCGGGNGGGVTHAGASGSNAVALSFVIPSASNASAKTRKPAYISTLTASIAVTVYPATSQPPSSPTITANVGPTLPGCTTLTTGTSCTVTVQAPSGNDTFEIAAYSGQNGTGSLLSQATVTENVTAGMAPIAVTLTAVGATVSGDMLGYVPSRTWTYTVNSGSTNSYGYDVYGSGYTGYGVGVGYEIGIYADPTVSNGITTYVAFIAPPGTPNPFSPQLELDSSDFIAGAMGVQSMANGYLVSSYGSVGNDSFGLVPGTPMLVPSTLQLGQSWNPVSNTNLLGVAVTATVTFIGAVPGIAYCPGSPANGATVRYTLIPQSGITTNSSVSYVPGCGITDYVASTGSEFVLTGVGSQSLGELDVTRKTESATFLGTLHTLWQRLFVKHGQ